MRKTLEGEFRLEAIGNMNALKAHDGTHGADVRIKSGQDILVIRDIDKAGLDDIDISF